MVGFIKKHFIGLSSFGGLLASGHIESVSLNHRLYQVRPKLVDINSNEPIYYPFTVTVNKCSGCCNTFDDTYAQICLPNNIGCY